ncbi:hypothetical protein DOY81_013806, partial [Sarcophaga bullata]
MVSSITVNEGEDMPKISRNRVTLACFLYSPVWIIIFARALQGCAGGFAMTALPMYVSEISTTKLRGATGSLIQLGKV